MKRVIALMTAILFVLGISVVSFAAETVKPATTATKAAEQKAAEKKVAEDKAAAEKKVAEDKAAAKKKVAEDKAAAEKKAAPAKVKMVKGEVTAVDAKAKTITVKGKKGDVVGAVDDKMMAGVKAGDKVAVKYTEADGKNIAKSVKKAEVKPVEVEKKAEPAKPAEKK